MVRVGDRLFASADVDPVREVLYSWNVRQRVSGYVGKEDIVLAWCALEKDRLQHQVVAAALAGEVVANDSDIAIIPRELDAIRRLTGVQLRIGVVTDAVTLNAYVRDARHESNGGS